MPGTADNPYSFGQGAGLNIGGNIALAGPRAPLLEVVVKSGKALSREADIKVAESEINRALVPKKKRLLPLVALIGISIPVGFAIHAVLGWGATPTGRLAARTFRSAYGTIRLKERSSS
jgi:hypothetical protein